MIYEVRARLFFTKEDEAKDFYHDCEVAYPKATDINTDTVASEFSIVELIENHHDEAPTSPCDVTERICSYPPPPE